MLGAPSHRQVTEDSRGQLLHESRPQEQLMGNQLIGRGTASSRAKQLAYAHLLQVYEVPRRTLACDRGRCSDHQFHQVAPLAELHRRTIRRSGCRRQDGPHTYPSSTFDVGFPLVPDKPD